MTGSQSRAPADDPWARRRRRADRLLDLYRTVILVFGGFLLGILSYAYRAGDDIVFWPWSLLFLLLVAGLIIWQRRRPMTDAPPQH